ncbi:sodium-dependent dicarboxylate transporter 2/3/5 [Anseongella ginsenosidimutans]|uniref:Sodium-dependent dicarboxylate transporter 2/3/5 n=1 Tax=Anseongella ginsenosidimutans TaxID=496056 RepID=A0A4R3KQC5_9SPHI|nr:DASS family sodium-coupled anion symporter [Anseongella ginsenosidimutans]QEC52580.1 DASS family sodium-coupled anion symporter [Anseongella ginsenosidimutans]TCS86497.1 sodium-dependent dicarboxylate transporter 2/3/5 [Anseongella ginsenosidimutans]
MKKLLFLAGGLLLFLFATLLLPALGLDKDMANVLAVALLMVFWWITEAVPIYMTALLPMILFPLLSIMSIQETTVNYGNNIIFLFFGGFLLARSLEKWNLHRRIALSILNITGTGPRKIILGTLLATAVLSMWISNTATAMMMLPIALSVVNLFTQENLAGLSPDVNKRNFATVMMLAVAYGANIGGIATLIGTPPNTVMAGILENTFGYEVGFSNWMLMGVPFSILLLSGSYFLLVYVLVPVKRDALSFSKDVIRQELAGMGRISQAEKRVLAIFSVTALLWIFRQQLQLLPGLQGLSDTQIAIFGGFLMYLVPAGVTEKRPLLDWSDAQGIPWGILLLFGGGLALAAAMETSGILERTAAYFSQSDSQPYLLIVLMIGFASVFLSELMSNTALATIMVPLAGSIATGLGMHPLALAAPVTLAASAAFMLPMGTPPNAIVFASGHISIKQMVKAGFFLNLLAILLIGLFAKFIMPLCFDLS